MENPKAEAEAEAEVEGAGEEQARTAHSGLQLEVFGMAGDRICEVSASLDDTVEDLKTAVAAAAGIPAHEQKLMTRHGWDLGVMLNDHVLKDCGVVAGTEIVMVRVQPFNGKYAVHVNMNGPYEIQILGTHAKVIADKGFEAEIQWEANPHRAIFSGRRMITTEWAQRHTKGHHKEDKGVLETFNITFSGDEAAAGFTGVFQREFEGPLGMSGKLVEA